MKNTKKIISIILVLMIVVMSIPIQAFAEDNVSKYNIEYHYLVADTSAVELLQNNTFRPSEGTYDGLFEEASIEQEWVKKLCNDISNNKIKVYKPSDYIKNKASKSDFSDAIPQEQLNEICNYYDNVDYNTRDKTKNSALDKYLYLYPNGFSSIVNPEQFKDTGFPWGRMERSGANTDFYIVGTFLGDYKDYNNSVHYYGSYDNKEHRFIIDTTQTKDYQYNENGDLIVYYILVPFVMSILPNVSYSGAFKSFSYCSEWYNYPYSLGNIIILNNINNKEDFDDYISKAGKYDDTFKKYISLNYRKNQNQYYMQDKRRFQNLFDDITYTFSEIEGFTLKGLNKEQSDYWKMENNCYKQIPYGFVKEFVPMTAIYKNTYTHRINFVDTEGNPINIDFRQYKYSNNFGKNNDMQSTLFININKNENPSQNDFNVSSIVWNNESNSFYNSKGELLKQDKENVPINENFNMFDNNYDIKIPKSLLNSVDGYTLSEFTQNNEKVTLEETKENNTDYYHFNTDITKGVTTLNVVFKKKSTPNVNNNATVNVKYVDENGKVISDDVIIKGKVNDPYETKSKKIYGYSLIRTPDNARGFMTSEPINVNYVYRLKDANVIVRYIDKENNEIEDTEVITGKVFDKYTTEAKDIDGYTLSVMPTNATGEMTEEPITVTYIYEQEPEVIVTEDDPKKTVDTGDSLPMTLIVMTIITLMLCIVYVLINKKKRTNEKE